MQVIYKNESGNEILESNGLVFNRKEHPHNKVWKIVDDYKKLLSEGATKPFDFKNIAQLEKLLSGNYNFREYMKEASHERV